MPELARPFVVLRHMLAGAEHWDLMLDRGESLATWQLQSDPVRLASPESREAIATRRIGDHRRAYLDYEGPIAGNRGSVTRVEAGSYVLMQEGADEWTVHLDGKLLRGTFQIGPLIQGMGGLFHRL